MSDSPASQPAAGSEEDPVLAFLAAVPIDDEPVSEDELAALAEARRAYRDGEKVAIPEARPRILADECQGACV